MDFAVASYSQRSLEARQKDGLLKRLNILQSWDMSGVILSKANISEYSSIVSQSHCDHSAHPAHWQEASVRSNIAMFCILQPRCHPLCKNLRAPISAIWSQSCAVSHLSVSLPAQSRFFPHHAIMVMFLDINADVTSCRGRLRLYLHPDPTFSGGMCLFCGGFWKRVRQGSGLR